MSLLILYRFSARQLLANPRKTRSIFGTAPKHPNVACQLSQCHREARAGFYCSREGCLCRADLTSLTFRKMDGIDRLVHTHQLLRCWLEGIGKVLRSKHLERSRSLLAYDMLTRHAVGAVVGIAFRPRPSSALIRGYCICCRLQLYCHRWNDMQSVSYGRTCSRVNLRTNDNGAIADLNSYFTQLVLVLDYLSVAKQT
jgi:hypothetical protein